MTHSAHWCPGPSHHSELHPVQYVLHRLGQMIENRRQFSDSIISFCSLYMTQISKLTEWWSNIDCELTLFFGLACGTHAAMFSKKTSHPNLFFENMRLAWGHAWRNDNIAQCAEKMPRDIHFILQPKTSTFAVGWPNGEANTGPDEAREILALKSNMQSQASGHRLDIWKQNVNQMMMKWKVMWNEIWVVEAPGHNHDLSQC